MLGSIILVVSALLASIIITIEIDTIISVYVSFGSASKIRRSVYSIIFALLVYGIVVYSLVC